MASSRVQAKKPLGRPSRIDDVARVTDDGESVLVWQAVVLSMNVQPFVEVAAAAAGVDKSTIYRWLERGAQARQLATQTNRPVAKKDETYVLFCDAAEKARAELEIRNMALIAQLARGGIRLETVTVKVDETGKEIERTVKTEHTLPDLKALTWTQEHAFRDRYGRVKVEVSGPDDGPIQIEAVRGQVAEKIERMRSVIEARVVEASERPALEA